MLLREHNPTLVVNDIRYSGKYSARLAVEEHIVVSQRTSANGLLFQPRDTCVMKCVHVIDNSKPLVRGATNTLFREEEEHDRLTPVSNWGIRSANGTR